MTGWNNNTLTPEKILDALRKAFKEHYKYTHMFCIGFIDTAYYHEDSENTVWVATDKAPKQNGKKFVLMKAGSRFHKYLLDLEEKEDIYFERLNDDTMRKINSVSLVSFTNEDGSFHNIFKYEPNFEVLADIGFIPENKTIYNTFNIAL
jgi:hypothetical protein